VSDIRIRDLGVRPMPAVWAEMERITAERGVATQDEIWFVEHPAVFTLGQSGNRAHLLDPGDIPVVQTDRGGQVTFHGPGQLVCYALIELRRRGLNIRSLVQALESAVIDTAREHGVEAYAKREAPGVYVAGRKLAAIGLRVRRGCSYHGMAVNVRMDLEPFSRINPCGYPGLEVTQFADLCAIDSVARCRAVLTPHLLTRLRSC
jgi:lipoyl(octanoyl) transferase